jgi:hypothetical protein
LILVAQRLWVAKRFSAAISGLFSVPALAAERTFQPALSFSAAR